jgi:hypothetical protein
MLVLRFGLFAIRKSIRKAVRGMDHYNGIIRQLDGPPESYRPLYLPEVLRAIAQRG